MSRKKVISTNVYSEFLKEISSEIRLSQLHAMRLVNQKLIEMYWNLGKKILEKQLSEGWGKSVVEILASDLQKEFPGVKGLSKHNLWRVRQFYKVYSENETLSTLARNISWTHNLVIMNKCKDELKSEFYIRMCIKFGWTKDVLINHIESRSYERTVRNQTNFERTLPINVQKRAKMAVKDEYIFDFLELEEEYSERQLEKGLVRNIEAFLAEIGDMFAFIRSQYRVEVEDREYFIDILLYHRKLRCIIAIELKIGEFMPEYIGKMQFYLSILDDKVKLQNENPSIGIILCRSKSKTIVEYALKDSVKPIGVASYQIMSSLPKELEDELPKPEQISKLLEGLPVSIETTKRSKEDFIRELPLNQKKIYLHVKQNGRISNQECQKLCEIQKRQVSNELSNLVSKNILKKVGTRGRGTYYILSADFT